MRWHVVLVMWAVITAASQAVPVRAQEPWLFDVELHGAMPVSSPQNDLFGFGAGASAAVYRPVAAWLVPGLRLRGLVLLDGDAPKLQGVEDPGLGSLYAALATIRLRPPMTGVRRATGLWVEVGGGYALTGELGRGLLEVGGGYGFAVGERMAVSPTVRFMQVFQSADELQPDDAMVAMVGVSLTLFDRVPDKPHGEPRDGDADGDGIPDSKDRCVNEPEDKDDFKDEDGCPEKDNDLDSILDPDDRCPNIAEDKDDFEDDDGCPDEDNDEDDILDINDECPLEAETLNGIEDQDGCPDQGLIEMRDDRIVLQETVLFDRARARVKSRARPVLEAIVRLWQQHPDWTKVRIEGHSDVRGDPDFNQRLSERRAINVRKALVKLGMDPGVVVAEGFGSRKLISEGTADQDHNRNRRVEFVVLARYGDLSDAAVQEMGLVEENEEAAAEQQPAGGAAPTGEAAQGGDAAAPAPADKEPATDAGEASAPEPDPESAAPPDSSEKPESKPEADAPKETP